MRGLLCVWFILPFIEGAPQPMCPQMCNCKSSEAYTECKHNSLTELPEGIFPEVLGLDLSNNLFENIPGNLTDFEQLKYLNMSHNLINRIEVNTLQSTKGLKLLDLSYNNFTDWMDINRYSLQAAPFLQELDLSYNTLRGFPDIMDHPLNSKSLETLLLVNCSITNLIGDILTGLPNLKKLVLANNHLQGLNTQLKSRSLVTLDLSQSNLQRMNPDVIIGLVSLDNLKLSHNHQLKNFNARSSSLKMLDISHCNLDSIPKANLPNLTRLDLQGNHIRHLPANSFLAFPGVNFIDLSNNAIIRIDIEAFRNLKVVQIIDLSFNKILSIEYETFATNTKLHSLNLSRNYLSEVGQLVIESIILLDLSVCEIRSIDKDSLIMMPKLQVLNLSRNLLTRLPPGLQAKELRTLDLSGCGIYQLNNLTFSGMQHLNYLNIAGNKLVSIRPQFFHDIRILHLDENAWFCNCESEEFKEVHHWLYNLMSISGLHCRYPENVAGLTWEIACAEVWYAPDVRNVDSMWIYSISVIILMTTLCCIVVSIRRAYHRKLDRARQMQQDEHEEAQEQLRCSIHQRIQDSTESIYRNAPDPREMQTPPSYSEAISMPRLNASCNSLVGSQRSLPSLHSLQSETSTRRTKVRRKRRRNRQADKSGVVSETQSTVSISRPRPEDSSSDEQTDIRPTRRANINVIESSF